METMIQVNELTKVFKTDEVETWALDKVNIEIGQGEFVAVMGPSGCGKTTTLRIIGGFETPSEGQVLFGGQDISALPPYKRRVNTVFQKYALFPHLNVYDNIAFGLKLKKLPKKSLSWKAQNTLPPQAVTQVPISTTAKMRPRTTVNYPPRFPKQAKVSAAAATIWAQLWYPIFQGQKTSPPRKQ